MWLDLLFCYSSRCDIPIRSVLLLETPALEILVCPGLLFRVSVSGDDFSHCYRKMIMDYFAVVLGRVVVWSGHGRNCDLYGTGLHKNEEAPSQFNLRLKHPTHSLLGFTDSIRLQLALVPAQGRCCLTSVSATTTSSSNIIVAPMKRISTLLEGR
ncbi:hypothetical protein VNO80_19877 [Phaseolus coccineus]|uniref:Uncharacterized protein n=1 Tax=Phaseolus coccineus TaxID=3886 RepID=A0AAN9MIC0_PHACN